MNICLLQSSDIDTRNIDRSFTSEPIRLGSISASSPDPRSASVVQANALFQGFSYVRPDSVLDTDSEGEQPER